MDAKDTEASRAQAAMAAQAAVTEAAAADATAAAIEADRREVLEAMSKLRALTPCERASLGLAMGTGEEVEHAMWGAAERYMGWKASSVSYEPRTFRCQVSMGASLFVRRDGSAAAVDGPVDGLQLPLGWKAPGLVRAVEFAWSGGGGPRLVSWSLGSTLDREVGFDGAKLDFYARSYADGTVRGILSANSSTTSRLVDDEFAEQCWDSYARRSLYVWFGSPVGGTGLTRAGPLGVHVSYYRPVFESDCEASGSDEASDSASAETAKAEDQVPIPATASE